MESFGERLNHLLKREKLSREDFAGLVGVHLNTVGHWIRNEKVPRMDMLRLISQTLKADMIWLFFGESSIDDTIRKEITRIILKDEQASYGKNRKETLVGIAEKLAKLDDDSLKIVEQLISKMGSNEERNPP